MSDLIQKVQNYSNLLNTVIRGKAECVELLQTALLAEGSVLLHDIPGVGKTTLAKAVAAGLGVRFNRIQFTPDLLPSDVLGSSIYHAEKGQLDFVPGPIFTNILLADEINRASPRTQSALLEAMNEQQISIENRTIKLPRPFMVIATENPVEYQGTNPLPEAQLDRFAMCLSLGYPDDEAELQMLFDRLHGVDPGEITAVLSADELREAQKQVCQVEVEKSVAGYLLALVKATREDKRLRLGASPRAVLVWSRCAQARAWLRTRNFVTPDDIRDLAVPVLAHRLLLENQSLYAGVDTGELILELLEQVKVPR